MGKLIYMDRIKRIWYLLPMRAAKVQDGMLEDTNSLDGAHIVFKKIFLTACSKINVRAKKGQGFVIDSG